MANRNQTSVKPDVEYLTDILDKISTGTLRVPNFQRPFVWKPEDMIALFESIRDGYPIGSLLFWRANKKYNSLPKIGPNVLLNENKLPINYILDGHQRLSTLYGVLQNVNKGINYNYEKELKNDNWKWLIFYDLEKEEFLHIKKEKEIKSHFINLRYIVKTTDFLKESNRILQSCGSEGEKYIEKAEKLIKAIRSYRISVTQIEGGDLESAVNIFARLNTKGHHMSIDRMYSALTYKEGSFNLSDRIDEIKSRLSEFNFSNIDRANIFRVILAASGKNLYYATGEFHLFKGEEDRLPTILDECEESVLKTGEFLYNTLKVPSDNFLPHTLQFVILSEFFRISKRKTKAKLKKIEQWFWVTSFVGIETTNSSKKTQALDEVREFAKLNTDEDIQNFEFKVISFQEEAREFPSRFDLNSNRVKAFVLFLIALNPLSIIEHNSINTNLLLSKHGYKALKYFLPKNKINLSSPANRIIMNPKYSITDIKKSLRTLVEANLFSTINNVKDILKTNVLDETSVKLLLNGNEEQFLKRREKQLMELEKQFMISKGVKPFEKT